MWWNNFRKIFCYTQTPDAYWDKISAQMTSDNGHTRSFSPMNGFACAPWGLICPQMISYTHCRSTACPPCEIWGAPGAARAGRKLCHKIHTCGWGYGWGCAWRGRACWHTSCCRCDTSWRWSSRGCGEFACGARGCCWLHNVSHNLHKCTWASQPRQVSSYSDRLLSEACCWCYWCCCWRCCCCCSCSMCRCCRGRSAPGR